MSGSRLQSCSSVPAYPLSGMITVPMSASMYQAVVANLTGGSGEQVRLLTVPSQ